MPADNVDRAIKKGTGELPGVVFEEMTYEGYGPGGVAFVVQCTTDNKTRAAKDVRAAFNAVGGNLAQSGAVINQTIPGGRKDGINIENASYITVSGFTLIGTGATWEVN